MTKVKELLIVHHSHLDIGYTHPQSLLLELQNDYIDEAIELCAKTENYPDESKFRWTCEATLPVLNWLETASAAKIDQFQKYLNNGQISISALLMHSTPLANSEELVQLLKPIKEIKEKFNYTITTAINHDVNGQPWPLSQILLDAGVEFYITGINVHYGAVPLERPKPFKWKTPDGRSLLTYLGEHYSLFSQFLFTSENDTAKMKEGLDDYLKFLEEKNYPYDFIYLTGTNPPLFDNNPPDQDLSDLVKKFNEENEDIKIKFITPEMLHERVKEVGVEDLEEFSGDWTDYWNFGSGSSANETRLSRRTKQSIKTTEFLESIQGTPNKQYDKVKREVLENSLLFEEHTWGAAQNITNPEHTEVSSQINQKASLVYEAASLSAYVLGKQLEKLADNPLQSTRPDGILLVNSSGYKQELPLYIPKEYQLEGRHLSARRLKTFLPYFKDDNKEQYDYFGTVEVEPYSWKKIPYSKLSKHTDVEGEFKVTKDSFETPFYKVTINPDTGKIKQIISKEANWEILDTSSEWTLFDFVHESIDSGLDKNHRDTFFPRDVDLGNKSISVWNHSWNAKRSGLTEITEWNIVEEKDSISYVIKGLGDGVTSYTQKLTFYTTNSKVKMNVIMDKEDITTPESIYFSIPLKLDKNWISQYDTAGMFVELGEEQLGTSSKDWVTVDQTVSVYNQNHGITVACPDAPLVQIGDFNFGKESKVLDKKENPNLLLWPVNNYWDTNFWASQPGRLEFDYVLDVFTDFNPVEAHKLGVYASNPVALNVAVDCTEETSGVFYKENNEEVVPLHIKLSDDKKGIIFTLRNLTMKDNSIYELKVNDEKKYTASIVDTLENEISTVEIENDMIRLSLQPRELVHVKIEEV